MVTMLSVVFYVSLAGIIGLFGLSAFEKRHGKRLVLAEVREGSDTHIVNAAEVGVVTAWKLGVGMAAVSAHGIRWFLSEAIIRGRRLSASLRGVAERRAVHRSRGAVSGFLQAIADNKKDDPKPPESV
jgi:hypothetical protein